MLCVVFHSFCFVDPDGRPDLRDGRPDLRVGRPDLRDDRPDLRGSYPKFFAITINCFVYFY
jgi:hypothetical protein